MERAQTNQCERGWAIFNHNTERYIGIDNYSGGYAYEPNGAGKVHLFNSFDEAESYMHIFQKSPTNTYGADSWEVRRVHRDIIDLGQQ